MHAMVTHTERKVMIYALSIPIQATTYLLSGNTGVLLRITAE